MTRSMMAGSAMTDGRPGGMSTTIAWASDPRSPSERVMIWPRSAGRGNTGSAPACSRLTSSRLAARRGGARRGRARVQGLLGGVQQVVSVRRGELDAGRAQAADRGLGRGQRGAQIVADGG